MMETKELEQMIEEKIRKIDNSVSRYEDRHEIEMVMAHYVMRDNPRNMVRNLEFFASSMPDVSIEWGDMGKFVGMEKVEQFLKRQADLKFFQGTYRMHWLATPVIEVAADRKTARAAWICPGAESIVDERAGAHALWNFVRFANDFIREDGRWKIWHLRMFVDVRCDYDKGWCEDYVKYVFLGKQPGSTEEEPTWHNPCTPSFIQEDMPSCPQPYRTWDGEDWLFANQPQYAPAGKP